jgi:hypothetical protein
MTECDNCEDDVQHVWRHRVVREGFTHRDVTWVCGDCHPDLPDAMTTAAPAEETADETETVIVTDGGRFACPDCSGPTVDGQGLYNCVECGWTGRY